MGVPPWQVGSLPRLSVDYPTLSVQVGFDECRDVHIALIVKAELQHSLDRFVVDALECATDVFRHDNGDEEKAFLPCGFLHGLDFLEEFHQG